MDEPVSKTPVGPSTEAVVRLFELQLGPLSPLVDVIAQASGGRGKPVTGELVIDVEALFSVLLSLEGPEGLFVEAHFLQQWSRQHQRMRAIRQPPDSKGLTPKLSRSVETVVLPRARALRDAMMRDVSEPVQLRHLLFALIEQPADKWPRSRPTDQEVAGLTQLLIALFRRNPLTGEIINAWISLGNDGSEPSSPPAERTPLLSDSPATVDELGRKPLADALAARLVRLQRGEAASSDPKAVMVHLHGAWGSGKSSLVRFLTDALEREQPPWLVVEFNAWRNARVKPPWWNMLTEFKRALDRRLLVEATHIRWILGDPSLLRWGILQVRWLAWQASQDWLQLMFGLGLLALAFWSGNGWEAFGQKLENVGKLASALGGLFFMGRAIALGGGKGAAEAFDALRTDSFRPFISLFDMLSKTAAPRPVLIVLDDLDRCDQQTVTDLLEGIQTLFRNQPVAFLAVADRHWITASFGDRFRLFAEGGDQARPVGDLFLDKMFQVSVTIPALPVETKQVYMRRLLGLAEASAEQGLPVLLPVEAVTHEAINAAIEKAAPEDRGALRAQAVQRLSTAAADRIIEHRLLRWVDHIEPNPRGMKRLVNAIGMTQARSLLEGRSVDFDVIVLWTILELRWPRAAGALATDPNLLADEVDTTHAALIAARQDPEFKSLCDRINPESLGALVGVEVDGLYERVFNKPA